MDLGRMEMSSRRFQVTVSSFAAATAETKYSDAATAKAIGIRLGTRYLWGRELGVTSPPERPLKDASKSKYDRVPGALPPSLATYLDDDWFWNWKKQGYGDPAPPKWTEELMKAKPDDNFVFLIRVVKKQQPNLPDVDVVQQIVPLSAIGIQKRRFGRYSPGKLKAPFELTSLRLPHDYDTMEKAYDIWGDDGDSDYEEPSDSAMDRWHEKFFPYAKAKWETHRAAFDAALDGISFHVFVHVVRRDTQQYACVVDTNLPIEAENTSDGSFDDRVCSPPKPTFGYDTIALRTPRNLDILCCCDATYKFQPQFALCFEIKNEEVLGTGDLVRTTFQATKMRLSFHVQSKAEREKHKRHYSPPGLKSTALLTTSCHSHNRTLILLRHFKELWRPALPS